MAKVTSWMISLSSVKPKSVGIRHSEKVEYVPLSCIYAGYFLTPDGPLEYVSGFDAILLPAGGSMILEIKNGIPRLVTARETILFPCKPLNTGRNQVLWARHEEDCSIIDGVCVRLPPGPYFYVDLNTIATLKCKMLLTQNIGDNTIQRIPFPWGAPELFCITNSTIFWCETAGDKRFVWSAPREAPTVRRFRYLTRDKVVALIANQTEFGDSCCLYTISNRACVFKIRLDKVDITTRVPRSAVTVVATRLRHAYYRPPNGPGFLKAIGAVE